MTDQAHFGACLRRLRQRRSVVRKTFARRAHVSNERLERIESGEESPTLQELDGLAYALEVPTLALLAYYDLCARDCGTEIFELLLNRDEGDLRSARRLLDAIFLEYVPDGDDADLMPKRRRRQRAPSRSRPRAR